MSRDHLKNARRAAGLTALRLSELSGIAEQKIYAVERGRYRPRRDEALTWAAALAMPPETAFPELFDTEGGRGRD